MPHYFFDIKDGHRLVDPSGLDCKNDSDAMEKARVIAIGVALDKPAVDSKRRISVLNADRAEISTVPVYSRPAWSPPLDRNRETLAVLARGAFERANVKARR
jgi:Domain of unknown function (DUF6894)